MDRTPQSSVCTVLALDGGGVRGLSSLLILQSLMGHINAALERESGQAHVTVEPQNVFSFFAGTSTGGLIAIMLGKMKMSLDECIAAYRQLSKKIFRHKHFRSRLTRGLAPAKYSAGRLVQCTQDLLRDKSLSIEARMKPTSGHTACAVVCREYINQNKHSYFKQDPVLICTLPCHAEVDCLVSEAVRATSAAITYFPPQKIGNRLFADGGLEYNNPSHAIYEHYDETRYTGHGDLKFSNIRIINIGTGTKTDDLLLPRSSESVYIPAAYRMLTFLKRTLVEAAVNAENVANQMKTLAWTSRSAERVIKFERFSADNGVCFIKLDKYKKLQRVEDLTRAYLEKSEVENRLRLLGSEIAREYLQKRRSEPDAAPSIEVEPAVSTPLPSLAPPNSTISTPPSAPLATPKSPEEGAAGRPSINDNADFDAQAVHSILTLTAAIEPFSSQPVPLSSHAEHHNVAAMT